MTFKENIWNPILSKIEEIIWKSRAGDSTLAELKKLAPNIKEIETKLVELGFAWSSDPLGGYLDYHSKPRVTCARKKGDCDDYAYLWKELLMAHGRTWILRTYSLERGHCMCVFEREGKYHLLSNLNLLVISTNIDAFNNCYFGDKTIKSILTM